MFGDLTCSMFNVHIILLFRFVRTDSIYWEMHRKSENERQTSKYNQFEWCVCVCVSAKCEQVSIPNDSISICDISIYRCPFCVSIKNHYHLIVSSFPISQMYITHVFIHRRGFCLPSIRFNLMIENSNGAFIDCFVNDKCVYSEWKCWFPFDGLKKRKTNLSSSNLNFVKIWYYILQNSA